MDRTARVLRVWASTSPKETGEGLTLKQEIKLIGEAMDHNNKEVLGQMPEAKVTEGVSINEYSTWRATRFADPD